MAGRTGGLNGDAGAWTDAEAVEYVYDDAVSWTAVCSCGVDVVRADETSNAVAASCYVG